MCITGASRGIGRATAVEAAKQGAAALILHYYGDDITTSEIDGLRKEIASMFDSSCQTVAIPGDIANRETSLKVMGYLVITDCPFS